VVQVQAQETIGPREIWNMGPNIKFKLKKKCASRLKNVTVCKALYFYIHWEEGQDPDWEHTYCRI
jgi:hypothetical protein